ncbi:MAG: sigma 54-interacting transcriptional regulator [Spirochaetes bacterium]|nr:sigma 54-interacting transcriptional regulator [Spirochaetota bacterium]
MKVRLQLFFKDRIGIVAEITALLVDYDVNITAMEVNRNSNHAEVYLEVEVGKQNLNRDAYYHMLSKISDLKEINFIETLPFEEKENRSQVILNNINEGVLSIDNQGKITMINQFAQKILNCKQDEVIGQGIQSLNLPDYSILDCLKGRTFDNLKQDLITTNKRIQFFASGKPIYDSNHQIIGAVEIMKDMKDIKDLAKTLSQPQQINFSDYIGKHTAVWEAISFAQKIAQTDSIISLRGESGTGKELFARAIHTESCRTGSFVAINCAALPEALLESELFGYVGGAFTGAKKEGKPGLFEIANNGTVFLDEIGEMPINLQAKMLRLIQEQRIRRIGGAKEIAINTRIITATNKELEKMVKEKTFREDFYYRINVLPVYLPPLRERKEDIPILVEHFLFQLSSKLDQPNKVMTEQALEKLMCHNWPGNIRELRNVIERAAILSDETNIDESRIVFSHEITENRKGLKKIILTNKIKNHSLSAMLDRHENKILSEVLQTSKSIRQAAKSLGISHSTLINKIKKYKLAVVTK